MVMKDKEKHRLEVLWKNARDSKVARKEIAISTPPHKNTTARGKVQKGR
jgi:hypothetical protein